MAKYRAVQLPRTKGTWSIQRRWLWMWLEVTRVYVADESELQEIVDCYARPSVIYPTRHEFKGRS